MEEGTHNEPLVIKAIKSFLEERSNGELLLEDAGRRRLRSQSALLVNDVAFGPAVFRLHEHVERLYNSCKIYRMDIAVNVDIMGKSC